LSYGHQISPFSDAELPALQATWIPSGHLFFWTSADDLISVVEAELPGLNRTEAQVAFQSLATPGEALKRKRTQGVETGVRQAIGVLATTRQNGPITDSIRCWAAATKFALKLAAGHRVVPTVNGTEAHWRAQLTANEDRALFDQLVRALPTVARALPANPRGDVRLFTPAVVLRSFLDHAVDALYRKNAYPGPAKGWALAFADALRGSESHFSPRDARHQGVGEQLARWSATTTVAALTVGFELGLPEGDDGDFPLTLWIHPADNPDQRVSMKEAWSAGKTLSIHGRDYHHPAHHALRGQARAGRLYRPLRRCLQGKEPKSLALTSKEAYELLTVGLSDLNQAGFVVRVPPEFSTAGQQRLRTRMRFTVPENGTFDCASALDFRWEVTLGGQVINGTDFKALIDRGEPIVKYKGQWVFLDPKEIAKLPAGMDQNNRMPASQALRAVLTGEHRGIPVVADDRLSVVIEALKNPPDLEPPNTLKATLRPYQREGFSWLVTLGQLGLGACLADDMGLGKTVQVIAYFLQRQRTYRGPKLVVCPTSVLGNWSRELTRFAPSLTQVRYHGLQRDTAALSSTDVVLTTYGLMVRDWETLADINWDILVLDEAQNIKNPDAQRAKAARTLVARHRIALSGTPIENRLDELWSLMTFLIPGLLGTRGSFRSNIALPIERFGDKNAARRLKLGLSPFLLRRVKTDPTVISDLPEKIERREYAPMTYEQAGLYKRVVQDSFDRIKQSEDIERRGHILAMLTALKQVCNHPDHYLNGPGPLTGRSGKLTRSETILDQVIHQGERALVFTQYRAMGSRLQSHFQQRYDTKMPFLHGGTPAAHREEMVRIFQEDADAPPVLFVSLRAGGTGLNLTRATHVIHYDRWWNPAVEDQATDRAYRIGQNRNVSVYKMICQGTLEERIDALLEKKRALAEQVVGSGERWVTELTDEALRSLVSLGDDAVVIEA
jgi:hypothetical protein